jgi:hypothetical protein
LQLYRLKFGAPLAGRLEVAVLGFGRCEQKLQLYRLKFVAPLGLDVVVLHRYQNRE